MADNDSILSEQQMAEVIAAAKDGSSGAQAKRAKRPRGQKVREIDFLRPAKLTVGQQQRIETIHQQLASSIGLQFSFEMRTNVQIELIGSSQTTWSDALAELPPDALGVIMETRPGRAQAILAGELPFILRLIDLMLGGSGDDIPPRDLTQIDFRFAGRLFNIVVEQLSNVWGEAVDLGFEIESTQAKIGNVLPPTAFDAALTVTLDVLYNENSSSTLTFIYPYVTIERAAQRLLRGYSGGDHKRDRTLDEAVESLGEIAVEFLVETGVTLLPLERVLQLQPGDQLSLGPVPTEMVASIARVPSYRVQPFYRDKQHIARVNGRWEKL